MLCQSRCQSSMQSTLSLPIYQQAPNISHQLYNLIHSSLMAIQCLMKICYHRLCMFVIIPFCRAWSALLIGAPMKSLLKHENRMHNSSTAFSLCYIYIMMIAIMPYLSYLFILHFNWSLFFLTHCLLRLYRQGFMH
jgi:hypothetical protein